MDVGYIKRVKVEATAMCDCYSVLRNLDSANKHYFVEWGSTPKVQCLVL